MSPEVIYYVAAGLDGYVGPPDGSVAWLTPFDGGGELARAFRAVGLIKEYIVSVIPIILGAGVRMFGEDGSPERLTLVVSQRYPSGIIQLRYVKEA